MPLLSPPRPGLVIVAVVLLLGIVSAFVLPSTGYAGTTTASYDQPTGYGAGTTGGGSAPPVVVTDLGGLMKATAGSTAKVVEISGTVTGEENVLVGSNTTILGVGSTATLQGISLDLKGVTNVIIRNLRIAKVRAGSTTGDAVHIEQSSHIWIDHNDLSSDLDHGKDFYDGLLDITHAGDFVTVSWNRLHDHYKVSLVGHSDTNGSEDTGRLHVTYAHNWFYDVRSRLPSVRFGTAHLYDNFFQNVGDSAAHSRDGAQMLVENNVFRNVGTALTTTGDSKVDGYADASGNDYGGATVTITRTGSFTEPPYPYVLDPTDTVISQVTVHSGVGVLTGSGSGTPPPTTTSEPTPSPAPTPVPAPAPPPANGALEAATAKLSGAVVATSVPGYSGSGYVSYRSKGGYIQWTVSVASAGRTALTFRYLNADPSSQSCAVAVDGETVKADLTMSGTDGRWSTAATSRSLKAGSHTVRLTSNTSTPPLVDSLTLES